MDAGHIILGLIAAAGLVGVVLLLIQRGAWLGRAAGLSADAAAHRAAREAADRDLAQSRAEAADLRTRLSSADDRAARLEEQLEAQRREHAAALEHADDVAAAHLRAAEQRERDLIDRVAAMDRQISDRFRTLAAEALDGSSRNFLELAKQAFIAERAAAGADLDQRKNAVEQLIRPIADTLAKTEQRLEQVEKGRLETTAQLTQYVRGVAEASAQLRDETGRLARALREPHIRGRYGELQLKRVAEIAGMTAYCDFTSQATTADGDQRPDMVVRLPSGRTVVVDAKANIQEYLAALQAATPEAQEAHLVRFADHVARQAQDLGKKRYWSHVEGSPEFVVMFIPGDQFIDAALSRRPDILEEAARQNVLLASPSTLIALLRAVAVGYREERLAQAAEAMRDLGREFYDRAAVVLDHASRMSKGLRTAVESFNDLAGSLNSRLLVTAKKFEDSGVKGSKDAAEVPTLEVRPRDIAPLPPGRSG